MKHQHHEWIVAFAEGKVVEYKNVGLDFAYDDWEQVLNVSLFDRSDIEFRFEPVLKRTVGYRRYVHNVDNQLYPALFWEDNKMPSPEIFVDFVKWLDKEWQYHDVEAN